MTPDVLLEFEARPWRHAGAKEQAIRDVFDLTPTAYYARLLQIIDDPTSLEVDAGTVRRLQRVRDSRAAVRYRRVA